MRFIILFLISLFSSYSVFAACSDQPANEVDWTNCNFVENLDLSGTGLANSQMSGVNLSLSNFEKSQLNNSNLSISKINLLANSVPRSKRLFLNSCALLIAKKVCSSTV